jgi:SAM-dependent methyltransferase
MLRKVAVWVYMKAHHWSSALGQWLGWEWLTYNPLVKYSFDRAARRNAPKMADAVLEEFPELKRLADVGCGGGIFAAEFQTRGVNVVGCEYSATSRKLAEKRGVKTYPFDLSKSQSPLPGRPYQAVITLEVGEHIPELLADSFASYLAATGDLIIFTAAQPGQGGHGHINEQPKSYWIEKFVRIGFCVDESATGRVGDRLRSLLAFSYLYNNLLILRKVAANVGNSA